MKKNKEGFVPVIIILVVLIGFVGVYFLGTLKNKPTVVNPSSSPLATAVSSVKPAIPTVKPTTDLTVNWETYNDSKFNYSFKFPNTWIDQTGTNDTNLGNFGLKSNENEWITGTVFTGTPDLENDKKNGGSSRSFVLNDQKYLLVVYVECMGPGCDVSKRHLDTFNQILSTFKFTN